MVPPPSDTASIEPIRQRFDPMAGLLPSHITLVFPFESDLTTQDLRKHVELAVEGVAPFALTLEGITGSERAEAEGPARSRQLMTVSRVVVRRSLRQQPPGRRVIWL